MQNLRKQIERRHRVASAYQRHISAASSLDVGARLVIKDQPRDYRPVGYIQQATSAVAGVKYVGKGQKRVKRIICH